MNDQELGRLLWQLSGKFGDFELRSGERSNVYFDKYQFLCHPVASVAVARMIANEIPSNIDMVAGVELGGALLAKDVARQASLPLVVIRKQVKEYATKTIYEGPDPANQQVLFLEDVITSGWTLVEGIITIRKLGAFVDQAVGVILRKSEATYALAEAGVSLKSLFTLEQLLELGQV